MTPVFVLVAIVALALLIVIHEFGHFIVARLCKMRVERFSIGFGKPLISFKRGDTIFQVAPIPLGGFVQITGLNPHEEFDHNDPNVYPNRPRWMRLAVLVAGPAANYVTAILLAIPFFMAVGVPSDKTRVAALQENSPAAVAGLQTGDVFSTIDGREISETTSVIEAVKDSEGKPLTVVVMREGKSHTITVTPKQDKETKRYLMGVHLETAMRDAGVGEAIVQSLVYPYDKSKEILAGIGKMLTREVDANVAGPVGIARAMAAAARLGVLPFLSLIIVLSIYLGLFNLLPFPALDGGRALFLGVQALGIKRITAKVEAAIHMAGLVLLLGVFVLVTFNDIKKFVTGEDDIATEASKPKPDPAGAPPAPAENQVKTPAPAQPEVVDPEPAQGEPPPASP